MRILVLTHNYPRFAGDPAGAFVARLAAGAAREGHEVRVLAPHAPGTALREEHDGVRLDRVRYAPDALERVGYRGDLHRVSAPLVALGVPVMLGALRLAFARAVREFAPDVVHAHWWIPGGWIAASAHVPFVVTSHGSDVRLLARSALARRVGARVLRQAAAVTTVSAFLARDVEQALPFMRGRVQVAPMPVDTERFAAGALVARVDPPRILYAGNLLESKGVADLVDAYALLRRRGIPCRLKLLGEGPALPALCAQAGRLGLVDEIDWSRFVPQPAMPGEYGAATVSVLPTRGNEEGLGLSLVESLLAGCAVVGTPAGGIPEVIADGETGLLARSADPASLADAIGRLLTDDSLRARLAREGGDRVRRTYSIAAATGRFLALYDHVRQRHRAA